MSNWAAGMIFSDYAPAPSKATSEMANGASSDSSRQKQVAGLQAEASGWYEDITNPVVSQYKNEAISLNVGNGLAQASAAHPASRLVSEKQIMSQESANRGREKLSVPAVTDQLELLRTSNEDLTPSQLMEAANAWAKRNNFSPEQLQEFGHLITMVAATYIPRSQIKKFRQLDQGSFGLIYSAEYDGSTVAVKQCSSDGSQIKAKMRELLLELSVLVRIRHPNIVTFWGTAAEFPLTSGSKPYMGMVFELCHKGSLYKALHQHGGKKLPFKEKMRFALEVSRGMSYVHAKGIIHRDLNSRNVLITDQMHAKVADFGCARKLKGSALHTTTISGSPAYMAPEQLEGHDLTDRIDVWAFGVLMWEIVTDQVPWASKGNSLDALKRCICVQGDRLPLPAADRFPSGWRSQYVKMMEMTWNSNPHARPSMADMSKGLEALINQEPMSVGEFM